MVFCVVFLLFILVPHNRATVYRLSDDEYDLMPPIVTLDPFESCLRHPGGRYCTTYAAFVSDSYNPLLQQMKDYSKHKTRRYNHTRALFGTCLTSRCENFYNTTVDLKYALEACLNHSVWNDYKLKVKLDEDISCHNYNEKRLNIGPEEIIVACIILSLVLCNAIGSLLDVFCTNLDGGLVVKFLLCFSIRRNWIRLTTPSENSNGNVQSFKGFYGIRALSVLGVIIAHSPLPIIFALKNPKFIEDQYDLLPVHILLNGTVIMQTFLFLSAFLLVYNFLAYSENHKVTWKTLPKGILRRWMRLTPPYAIVLAVTATWLKYVDTGPIWDHVVVKEVTDCRRFWWQHLLYINNYEDDSYCMPQTWYLATDTQLYCLGLVVVITCRNQVVRRLVLSSLLLMGMLLPALHTYYQDLDGALIISPETTISFFKTEPTYNNVYKRGHTNMSSYVIGMAFGYLVYSLQKDNFDITKSRLQRWRFLYWSLFPIGISITLFCKIFYDDPRIDLQYRVLISAFIKPVFGLITGLLIVGMVLKIEKVYRGVLEWDGWTCPGRVSYSAYLLHLAFIRTACGVIDHPIHVSYLRVVENTLSFIVMTFVFAYIFFLTVEAPLAQVIKTCLETRFEEQKTKEKAPKKDDNVIF